VVTAPVPTYDTPDHVLLEDSLQGRQLSPQEAADLSDRMLMEGGSSFQDEKTMARLELLLYKTLKTDDRQSRPRVLRNLGIVHYHRQEYKRARQELQKANELNPRDARTHFYLARLYTHQGQMYQKKGLKKKARGQFKLAEIELGQARKLEPNNALYRQELKEVINQERLK
jgi:tetratricopeptide (TPR) repeat protein